MFRFPLAALALVPCFAADLMPLGTSAVVSRMVASAIAPYTLAQPLKDAERCASSEMVTEQPVLLYVFHGAYANLDRCVRTGTPAVMGRLRDGKLLLDVRTVFPEQEQALVDAVRVAAGMTGTDQPPGSTAAGNSERPSLP